MTARLLDSLNPAQREVVAAKSGAVLALAGAGTGKTHTVTARIAGLIAGGMLPENILAVTFTNKAAGEMKERLRKMLPRSVKLDQMFACTFHSLCLRIIRRNPELVGLSRYFTIIDQGQQIGIIRKAARNVHGGPAAKPEDLLAAVSRIKSMGLTPEEFSRRALEDADVALGCIYRKYQEAMRLCGVVDFDDLLLFALQLLENHPEAGGYWMERFQQIVVDEFQDTSEIQYRIVKLLAKKWGNLCVVGDDDQSIYSWRGAVPGNILHFGQQWPGAKIIYLQENYRSRNAILKLANAVIAVNTARHKKSLFSHLGEGELPRLLECEDQENEAQTVVREICQRLKGGRQPKDFAVIVRANMQTRAFEEEMRTARVPCEVIGGQSFFDCKEVMDMLAFLSLAVNPKDDTALRRIINTPPRGIGEKAVERLTEWAARQQKPLTAALAAAPEIDGLTSGAREGCADLAVKLRRWGELAASETAGGLVDLIIAESNYAEEVKGLYDNPLTQAGRMDMAREVGADMAGYLSKGGNIADYVSETMLAGTTQKRKKKTSENTVKLITIHSAKGLEYPIVYVAGVEETLLPTRSSINEDNIDEERRLFYVAITRAREELTITYCANRRERGKLRPRVRSRFLGEIPDNLFASASFRPAQEAERAAIFANIRAALNA